jgi:Glycerol-3-phosphate dehydrogenase
MPITEQMHAILNEGKSPRDAIHEFDDAKRKERD